MKLGAIGKGLALVTATTLVLAACSSSSDSSDTPKPSGEPTAAPTSSTAIISTNGSEPENPLIPGDTNEVGGGKILDNIFAGLIYYDADGAPHNEVAESITQIDPQNFEVKVAEGWTFTNGEAVTAKSFVDAWNYTATASNAYYNSYFFEDIVGFSYDEDSELTGLKIVDEYTFTIELNKPASDFGLRLGYTAYVPLPSVFFENPEAFGENPIGNGPYKLSGEGAWQHNVKIDLVVNEDYDGPRKPKNGGLTINFYESLDAAYADLQGNRVDVIDGIPDSALATFHSDLGDRAVTQAAAIFQSFTIPGRLDHFSGEEGQLRRQALSLSINRQEIADVIFNGTRTPASDFTSPVIDGFSDSLAGADVLEFNPERAVELWAQADAINPWTGTFELGYNSDGSHAAWVDAVINSIKNTLGIPAEGKPFATFQEFRKEITSRNITSAFRTGWQADYPGQYNFLGPLYATNAGANDGDYSSAEFDALIAEGISADTLEVQNEKFSAAQEVLLRDLPAIPLFYSTVNGGFSENVSNVKFGWNSVPIYYEITK